MSTTSAAAQAEKTGGLPGTPAETSEPSGCDDLFNELRQKEHTILVLQKKLSHFRTWVSQVHSRVQQVNPQAVKNSRRLYVGGLPQDTTEDDLKSFFQSLMSRCGALASPGPAVLNVRITPDKGFAFVEFRSVEETSNAMAFDGVAFKDSYLKIRRPSNFDPSTAIMLGPLAPDPTMDTSTLDICRTLVEDSPHKLFVGGLPCEWGEEQVKDLLLPYGTLRSFNLVMDKATGKSKGYAFCEFADESTSDTVIRSLHMKRLGNKSLTVKRALEGGGGGGSITGMRSGGSGSGGGGGAMLGTSPLATSGSGQLASFGSGPYGLQHGGGSGSPTGTQGGAGALLAKLVGYPSASMPMSMSMQGGGHSQYQPSPTGAGPSMGGQDSPADLQGALSALLQAQAATPQQQAQALAQAHAQQRAALGTMARLVHGQLQSQPGSGGGGSGMQAGLAAAAEELVRQQQQHVQHPHGQQEGGHGSDLTSLHGLHGLWG